MGTQFWWFYDVLIVAIAGGLLYNAVSKGFNRMVFPLIGSILAFVVGFFGSDVLAEPVYQMLFRENLEETFQIEYEELDFYPEVLSQYHRMNPDLTMKEKALKEALAEETVSDEVTAAVGQVVDELLSRKLFPLPQERVTAYFAEHPTVFRQFIDAQDAAAAASVLEEHYFRPFMVSLVRMALFLLLLVVVFILVSIIANMAGNLEEQMHIRKCNRLLAFPIGLLQTACVLIAVTVAIRLIVLSTENSMILFNQETIEKTQIFHYLYERI